VSVLLRGGLRELLEELPLAGGDCDWELAVIVGGLYGEDGEEMGLKSELQETCIQAVL
jgi:hypothetical protein